MRLLCIFCKKRPIAPGAEIYCSILCNKRSWYVRNLPKGSHSSLTNDPEFWKTETGIGLRWEKYAARFLKARHRPFSSGADLLWNGKLIDVKVSKPYFRKFKNGKPVKTTCGVWVFNRNKSKPIDFFFCIALKNGKPAKKLLIPANEFPKSGIVIGKISRYDRFEYKP